MTDLEYIICEAEANGEISIDTRDEMLSVITEKKTREQYRLEKFKKRHNFIPDYPGAKTGYITVDGEKHRVDLDIHRKDMELVDILGNKIIKPRNTSIEIHDPEHTIHFCKRTFNDKNKNRIDSSLYHELGHKKFQYDKKYDNIQAMKDSTDRHSKLMDEFMDKVRKNPDKAEELYEELKRKENDPSMFGSAEERMEVLKKVRRYINQKSSHSNTNEFEADAYAASKVGTKATKANIRANQRYETRKKNNLNKNVSSIVNKNVDDGKKREKIKKQIIKNINKDYNADTTSRMKALNGNEFKNARYLKEK